MVDEWTAILQSTVRQAIERRVVLPAASVSSQTPSTLHGVWDETFSSLVTSFSGASVVFRRSVHRYSQAPVLLWGSPRDVLRFLCCSGASCAGAALCRSGTPCTGVLRFLCCSGAPCTGVLWSSSYIAGAQVSVKRFLQLRLALTF